MVHCRRIAARGQYLQIVMTALLRCQDSHGARNQKGSLRSETVIRGILEVSSSATVFGSARSHGEAIKQTPHSLNLK